MADGKALTACTGTLSLTFGTRVLRLYRQLKKPRGMPFWLRAVRVPLGERPERTDVHTCQVNPTVSYHLVPWTMDFFRVYFRLLDSSC